MPWQLILLNGTQAGKSLVLKEKDSIIVGRGSHCDLYLADKGVSRTHGYIWEKDGEVWIKDTESANGTFVNDKEIKEQKVNVGDFIKFGNTIIELRVAGGEVKEPRMGTIRRKANAVIFRKTKDDAPFSLEVAQSLRVKRDIALLHKIAKLVQMEMDITKLLSSFLETLLPELSVEKGHIFLKPLSEEIDSISIFRTHAPQKKNIQEQTFLAHRSILNLAMFKNEGTVSTNPLHDLADGSPSSQSINSLLCVPIEGPKSTWGALYLDVGASTRKFDKEDLDLISALANQLGYALERCLYEQKCLAMEQQARMACDSLVKNFRDILYRRDPHKNFLLLSPSIEKLLGYSCEEFLKKGDLWEECIYPEHRSQVENYKAQAFQGQEKNLKYKMIRKDGTILWVEDFFYPVFNEKDNTISCIQGTLRDITANI